LKQLTNAEEGIGEIEGDVPKEMVQDVAREDEQTHDIPETERSKPSLAIPRITFFEFLLCLIAVAKVVVPKEETLVAKVRAR
jgi:hypothetical protein